MDAHLSKSDFNVICWIIWNERNTRIFLHKSRSTYGAMYVTMHLDIKELVCSVHLHHSHWSRDRVFQKNPTLVGASGDDYLNWIGATKLIFILPWTGSLSYSNLLIFFFCSELSIRERFWFGLCYFFFSLPTPMIWSSLFSSLPTPF